MISPTDSRALDLNAEALGVPVSQLMDRAGASVASVLDSEFPDKKLLFVCGPGNNGGDGFSAALKMDPSTVRVALLKEPSAIHSDCARASYSMLECPIERYSAESIGRCDIVVDCALGTGISGSVREPYLSFIRDANASGKPIVSVDIPSGLGTADRISPAITVTFHDVKTGMDESNCGRIIVKDIGIPPDASEVVGPGDMIRYPIPKKDGHKGQNGKLMVIAGGPYFGAPVMASVAALKVGTDIVRVFTPESSFDQVASSCPVLMATRLPGDHLTPASVDMLLGESENFDAVLIGPGLGVSDDTTEAVRDFVARCPRPLVVDADGITSIHGMVLPEGTVITPHRNEFRGLGGTDPESLAISMNAVVLLKGPTDIITDGSRTRRNRSGTPAMTGAGTGDVLAGIVSGLLSKKMTPFDAACLGAFICGCAGEQAFATKSYGLIATDVMDCIPAVLREHLERTWTCNRSTASPL